MSHRNRLAAILVSSLLLVVLPALALAGMWPNERDGWMLGANLGGGTAGLNVSGFDTDRETGVAGSLRFGYAFQNQFAVGLEGNAWTKSVDNETWTFSVGGPSFTYYPAGQGFYMRAVVGGGRVEYKIQSGGSSISVSDTGFGLIGGAGYEFRVARRFALGPQIDYSYSRIDSDLSINYWNFTVGGNFYF
jgi:hypothetical protein